MSEIATRQSTDLDHFDPDRAVKEILSLEAAEKYARLQKDTDALIQAVERKAATQRAFVLWWDAQEKDRGGRAKETSCSTVGGFPKVEDYGLNSATVCRWRQRFADPEKFDRWLKDARARVLKTVEAHQAANYSSESVEWYTPAKYVESARKVMGAIDLDPASNDLANRTVQAAQIFTAADDGLCHDWHGRVFMNPPYGRSEKYGSLAGMFCIYCIQQYDKGNVEAAIILVNSLHSQQWQRDLFRFPVCLVDHRIQFVSGDGEKNKNPTMQNMFVYLGHDVRTFALEFSAHGYVMTPCSSAA